jgi:hypothetical protein
MHTQITNLKVGRFSAAGCLVAAGLGTPTGEPTTDPASPSAPDLLRASVPIDRDKRSPPPPSDSCRARAEGPPSSRCSAEEDEEKAVTAGGLAVPLLLLWPASAKPTEGSPRRAVTLCVPCFSCCGVSNTPHIRHSGGREDFFHVKH